MEGIGTEWEEFRPDEIIDVARDNFKSRGCFSPGLNAWRGHRPLLSLCLSLQVLCVIILDGPQNYLLLSEQDALRVGRSLRQ